RIYDLSGRQWRRHPLTSTQLIDLRGLPAGLYQVEVRSQGQWYQGRLMLER
ncbi:MAG: T9SS C-terminal target domain-containing protein, partial [Bacteroidetes bacterium]